jgi:Protein of unknown function (DUF2510)
MNAPTPGWHPDPTRRHHYRYWDGNQWTDDVADRGVTSTDPIGLPPDPAADPTGPADPTAILDPTARIDATRPDAPYAAPHHPPADPGRKRPSGAVIAAIAVAAVALIGGIVYVVARDDDDSADDPTEVADEDPTATDPGDGDGDSDGGTNDGGTNDGDGSADDGGTDDNTLPDDIDGENRDELVEFLADNMEQASGGVLTHDEALCVSESMLDELGVEGLVDLGQSDENPFVDPELGSQLARRIMDDCGISLEDLVTSG